MKRTGKHGERKVLTSSAEKLFCMGRILCWLLLLSVILASSGCGTILGGIIGYQSGELCAGLAIGAAVDFGDDLARTIAESLADMEKEFQQNSEFNAEHGTITLPGVAFTPARMQCVKQKLQEKLKAYNWKYKVVRRTAKKGLFRKDEFHEKWECKDDKERSFDLEICYQQAGDARLTVKVDEDSQADKAAVTSQIYEWLEEIARIRH